MRTSILGLSLIALVATANGCTADSDGADQTENDFSSNQATLLTFEFDGELTTTDGVWDENQTINDQLLFTIGHLNGDHAVGRLDNVVLTNVNKTENNGTTTIAYHAKLPVAWGAKTKLPKSYTFLLPHDISQDAQQKFTDAHKDDCVDPESAGELDVGSVWYFYRPNQPGCKLATGEAFKSPVKVTKSKENTKNKYPEYDKVWEDKALRIVAIFGKFEAGATTTSDAGIQGFDEFVADMQTKLAPYKPVTTPATISDTPALGEHGGGVTFDATLPDGKKISVTALLTDGIAQAPQSFYDRYESLSGDADIIAYNGHSGLGQNVRALSSHGKFKKGKYQIFFMNGCDSFAYVDGSLAQTRAALNPDDPTGTKYMEFVTNAMPAFFASMPNATNVLMDGLLSYKAPKTYDQIFAGVDSSQIILVTGEEDNTYTPATPIN
jgi:hypothetical protein